MPVRYLGRKRDLKAVPKQPCCQLLNVSELEGTQRCTYCHYYQHNRSYRDYISCTQANCKSRQSLLFLTLQNRMSGNPIKDEHFTPTPLVTQTKVDSLKRYVQLFSSDITGYQCASLCQFYPARIEAETTIASCASTHGCGANGSFFDLLTPVDTSVLQLPDFRAIAESTVGVWTMAGTQQTAFSISHYSIDGRQRVVLSTSDGEAYLVRNMMPDTTAAGLLLRAPFTDPSLWAFDFFGGSYPYDDNHVLALANKDSLLYRVLESYGMDDGNLTNPLLFLMSTSDNKGNTLYFAWDVDNLFIIYGFSTYPIVYRDYLTYSKHVFRFPRDNNKLLVSPIPDSSFKYWRKAAFTGTLPDDVTIVDINGYTDDMAQFFIKAGAKESIFY